VLQNDTLTYFENEKDYQTKSQNGNKSIKSDKVLHLRGTSQTSFTTTDNCLSITNVMDDEDGAESAWFLLMESEE
jgi:hypothetical protein